MDGWTEQRGCADVKEGEVRDMSWMSTPAPPSAGVNMVIYGAKALLIDAPVRQRAAGA